MPQPVTVTLFTRPRCHLCDAVDFVIRRVQRDMPFQYQQVNIDEPEQADWRRRYDHHVPVVHLDGREIARHRVDEQLLRTELARALGG